MFTLIRKIIERLKYLPLADLTTTEKQIFKLLAAASLMRLDGEELVDTGLQLPDTVPVLTRNGDCRFNDGQGVEIQVEIPKAWTHQLECHGLIRAISGEFGNATMYQWLGKE